MAVPQETLLRKSDNAKAKKVALLIASSNELAKEPIFTWMQGTLKCWLSSYCEKVCLLTNKGYDELIKADSSHE